MATHRISPSIISTVSYRLHYAIRISKSLTTSYRSYKTSNSADLYSNPNPLVSPTSRTQPNYVPDNESQSSESSNLPNQAKMKPNKAGITFGSKLAGPAVRQRYIEDLPSLQATGQGTYIGGIWIPPKPSEPDNCCMSGCVNCVWDGYREELEEWIDRGKQARDSAAKACGDFTTDTDCDSGKDGVGSGDWGLDNAMEDIPVGIREFMKIEKRLQQQRKVAAG